MTVLDLLCDMPHFFPPKITMGGGLRENLTGADERFKSLIGRKPTPIRGPTLGHARLRPRISDSLAALSVRCSVRS